MEEGWLDRLTATKLNARNKTVMMVKKIMARFIVVDLDALSTDMAFKSCVPVNILFAYIDAKASMILRGWNLPHP